MPMIDRIQKVKVEQNTNETNNFFFLEKKINHTFDYHLCEDQCGSNTSTILQGMHKIYIQYSIEETSMQQIPQLEYLKQYNWLHGGCNAVLYVGS